MNKAAHYAEGRAVTDLADTPAAPAGWADAIAARVNTFGLGLWFKDLEIWLGLEGQPWLPQSVDEGHMDIPVPLRGLQLRLYARDTFAHAPEPFRIHHIVLEHVYFNGAMARERPHECALPFGLDPRAATHDSVLSMLRPVDSYTLGKRDAPGIGAPGNVYLLEDDRVVGIDFSAAGQGIEYVQVVRRGEAAP